MTVVQLLSTSGGLPQHPQSSSDFVFLTLAVRDFPLPHLALGVSWGRVLVGPEWVTWGLEYLLVQLPHAF